MRARSRMVILTIDREAEWEYSALRVRNAEQRRVVGKHILNNGMQYLSARRKCPPRSRDSRSLFADFPRPIQRRKTHHVPRLHIGAMLQEKYDDVRVVRLCSFNERGVQ
jgi:hypothetical protein